MNQKCVVGKRIFRNYNFLKLLVLTSKAKRLELLENATPDQICSIIEIAANIIKYNRFCLNKADINDMRPFKKKLIQLANMTCPKEAKTFSQKGGGMFLPALILPVLFEITRQLLSR